MENYDSLFVNQTEQKSEAPFNKEEWAERKQAERTQLYQTIDKMADKALTNPDLLAQYLDMQSKLGRTSVANTLLVAAQKPDATYIADFDDWQAKGRFVKRGEKGFLVLEAGREYTREDGSMGMSFKAKRVFDVSQTHGKPVRERISAPIRTLLKALATETPVVLKLSDSVSKEIGASYSKDDGIVHVARGLEGEALFTAVARELVHTKQEMLDEARDDFVSGCAAVIICKRYGIDPMGQTYIPEAMIEMTPQEKRDVLGSIREDACEIMKRVDSNLYAERQQTKNQPER